jgi:hypothetical protein
MRIKIVAKTPGPESWLPGKFTAFCGEIAKVVNADTGEEIEGIRKLELVLSPKQIVHARLEVEVAELDIDIEVEAE